ncbi:hypothetical protein K2173_009023 [Erythroxylum novogranatense]|uniref:NPF family transporter n=1 Tax=Erythroxylum novogranatense TaxID=1862640 RepID=A0AAV8TSK6_9ROSI|nr:hypothetical protein K2173_009023 [Erythroxylum novogranatense]
MAISDVSTSKSPLIEDTVDGCVDYCGRPVRRSSSGGWRSACFIIAAEVAERFAYFGIYSNLMTYLTGPLAQPTASSAENVNTWSGTATLLSLLGALVADSYLGRYRTILFSSLIYILGLGLLTLSAAMTSCQNTRSSKSCSPSQFQVTLFFLSLYLVAIGQGGHKACIQAFGADQFDGQHPKESKAKSSFFNWWYFSFSMGILFTQLVLVYIQDNVNWILGFGIPLFVMLPSVLFFLLGTRTYRFSSHGNEKNPITTSIRVLVRAVRNRITNLAKAWRKDGYLSHKSSGHLKFPDTVPSGLEDFGSMEDGNKMCIMERDVEEGKAMLRLIPIWATSLIYAIVFAQTTTFFTKQGATMDRTIISGFDIPPASLQSFIGIAIISFVPIYDRIFVPVIQNLTGKPSGITTLQRIGTGMFISTLSMVIAALVETKRLKTAEEHGMIDLPYETVPISVWWLAPQYVLCGISDVFTIIGLQEFFYSQVPRELRSVGLSLYFSVMGVGSFLSSFLISIIDRATDETGRESWFSNNLNRAHLNYFYWLLALLNAIGFTAYLCNARSYNYRREHMN